MKRKKTIFLVLTIGWLCFIFTQSLMDHTVSYTESETILQPIQEITPEVSHDFLRNFAHFVIFAIWGGLLYGLLRQYENFNLLKPIGIALCGGFADETIQLFVPGRYGEVVDIWLDLAGATCMILLTHLVVSIVARKKRSESENAL